MSWNGEGIVLWSDDVLVVVDKPPGLLAIRGGYGSEPYVAQILEPLYGRLWVVHRLDRQTSGVIVYARSADAHRFLNTQFEQRRVTKVYHALVDGLPAWEREIADLALRKDGDRRHRTVVDTARGLPATTRLTVLERFVAHTLVEAVPETGRTHQIRAHLSALGHPIVGDQLYVRARGASLQANADQESASPIGRTALHALSLEIAHPATGERVCYRAGYPEDLSAAIGALRARKGHTPRGG